MVTQGSVSAQLTKARACGEIEAGRRVGGGGRLHRLGGDLAGVEGGGRRAREGSTSDKR
jgi:hypothetical protein